MKNDMKCGCGGSCKKDGSYKNVNGKAQRYLCLACGKRFSDAPVIEGSRLSVEKVALITQMLCEGIGIRAASRLAQVDQKTVLSILEIAGKKAEKLMDEKVRNLTPKRIEIDEVYGFVGCLQKNVKEGQQEFRGEQWAQLSMDADTKMIVNVFVGKRNIFNSGEFLADLKERVTGRFQITTDGFKGYTAWNSGVRGIFSHYANYAVEVKQYGPALQTGHQRFNPIICKSVKRTKICGRPNMKCATVNHAERTNLSIRLFNKRFARKTLGYSKKLENHRFAMLLQAAHFNFCRVHSSLRKTPAMAAGLTDKVWTVKELIVM